MNNYTVWVDGVEVNDYLLSKEKAIEVKEYYISLGYDQVQIDRYQDEEVI
jgi:hypothetical protein